MGKKVKWIIGGVVGIVSILVVAFFMLQDVSGTKESAAQIIEPEVIEEPEIEPKEELKEEAKEEEVVEVKEETNNELAFVDETFEKLIREVLEKPEGILYEDDLRGITHLTIIGHKVLLKTEDGTQYTNDERLDQVLSVSPMELYEGRITMELGDQPYEVEIGTIENLQDLNLFPDMIEVIIVGQEGLALGALDVEALPELRVFASIHCQLKEATSLEPFVQLEALILAYNQLAEVTFMKEMDQLSQVNLAYNQIKNLDGMEKLLQLESLNICDNVVEDLMPIQNSINLIQLLGMNNRIKSTMPLQNMSQLKYLYLNSNQINNLTGINNLAHLEQLGLQNNQITSLEALYGLTNLTFLGIAENPLESLISFNEFSQLEGLDLRFLETMVPTSIFTDIPSVEVYLTGTLWIEDVPLQDTGVVIYE